VSLWDPQKVYYSKAEISVKLKYYSIYRMLEITSLVMKFLAKRPPSVMKTIGKGGVIRGKGRCIPTLKQPVPKITDIHTSLYPTD